MQEISGNVKIIMQDIMSKLARNVNNRFIYCT